MFQDSRKLRKTDDTATCPEPTSPERKSDVPSLHTPEESEESHGATTQNEKNSESDNDSPTSPPRNLGAISWTLVIASLLSWTFLFALDNTVVADVQPEILATLGQVDKLPWLSVTFALGALSTSLIWGKCNSKFNVKLVFITAMALFEVGSAVCGSAPNMNAMIVGRALCSVGGIGIYIGALNVISLLTTIAERPAYISFIALTWGTGTVLGPVVGGAFADSNATWRWSFYINLCIGGAASPVFIWLVPSLEMDPDTQLRRKLQNIDCLGIALSVGACVSGTMAISFGGSLFDWRSGQIVALFCCSGALWILFGLQQSYCFLTTPTNRLFPMAMVKSWEMCVFFAQTSAAITTAFIPIYFVPLFFQFTRGTTALQAGVRLLPFVLPEIAAVIANGVLMAKFGWYMPWYLLGGALCVVGSALLYTTNPSTNAGEIYGYSVILGLGSGAYSQASFSIVQAKNAPQLIPAAVAFVTSGQLVGLTLALAISNSIFLNRATQGLKRVIPTVPVRTLQASITGAEDSYFGTLSADERITFLSVIVKSINDAYVMVIVAGALSVLLAAVMKRERLFLA